MSQGARNSCFSCKQGKRRCDRARPTCSNCSRIGRTCRYEEDQDPGPSNSGLAQARVQLPLSHGQRAASPIAVSSAIPETLAPINIHEIDPFRFDALRKPSVDTAISTRALQILGSLERMETIATTYFNTVCRRLSILSKERFLEKLPSLATGPQADFTTLCLCIYLIQENPPQQGQSMQSSLYITIKSMISLLESTNYSSLEVVQCRLIICYYEFGHGIYPAATISIGACARLARAIGLNKSITQTDDVTTIEAEERRRVWWAVINFDRLINLCNGDYLLATEDPKREDFLPIEDDMWLQNQVPRKVDITLSTSTDITVGPFARECQVSHLAGRLLRHVFDPTSDPNFDSNEANQLERTLLSFMSLLIEEETRFGLYCAALGICSSSLFMLYDYTLLSGRANGDETIRILQAIESTSIRITQLSAMLFSDTEKIDYRIMSPFITYSLYQAAIVQLRLWKHSNAIRYKEHLDTLKVILGYFNKRWQIAGQYLKALETSNEEWSSTILSMQGFCISIDNSMSERSTPNLN